MRGATAGRSVKTALPRYCSSLDVGNVDNVGDVAGKGHCASPAGRHVGRRRAQRDRPSRRGHALRGGSGPHRAPASPGRFCRTPTEIPDGAQPSRCALNQAGIADASRAAALGLFCTDLSAAKDAGGAFLERDASSPIFQIGQRRRKRRGRRERNHARKRRRNGRRRQSAGQRAKTDSIRCSPIRDVANVGNVGDVAGRGDRRRLPGSDRAARGHPETSPRPPPGHLSAFFP